MLALAPWPEHEGLDDLEAEAEIGWVVDLVTAIRSVRAEMNVPAADPARAGRRRRRRRAARAGRWGEIIRRLARLSEFRLRQRAPQGSVQLIVRGEVVALPLKGVIDFAAEKSAAGEGDGARSTPTSPASTPSSAMPTSSRRAPEEVVEGEREKREEAEARRSKINEALERLKGAA